MSLFEKPGSEDQVYEMLDDAAITGDYDEVSAYIEEEGIDEFEAVVGYVQEAMEIMNMVLETEYTEPSEVVFRDVERKGAAMRFRKAEKIREYADEEEIIGSDVAAELEEAMSDLECTYRNVVGRNH